ncbi:MAG: alpha/beta hydrolase-fold protein, partial [Mycobacteriales bacterium]
MVPVAFRRAVVTTVALAVLPSGAVGRAASGAMTCTGAGRERTCTVAVPRSVHVRHTAVRVVVPADYNPRRRYPVLYVLHGVGDDETTWTNPARGDLLRLTARCEAIFVMPDAGSGQIAGWYSDWLDGSFQWETF